MEHTTESSVSEWLAALLMPREVAPHPNFWSSEEPTPAGVVALMTSARSGDLARLRSDDQFATILGQQTLPELLDAVTTAMSFGSVEEGGERLAEIASTHDDAGIRTVAAVLGASALAECDLLDTAAALLTRTLLSVEGHAPELKLARATLHLAIALNSWDAGTPSVPSAESAMAELAGLDDAEPAEFRVGEAYSRDYRRTFRRMVESLTASAGEHLVNSSESWEVRVEAVRNTPSHRTTQSRSRVANAFETTLKATFESLAIGPTRTWTFGGDDGGDSQLCEALFLHEYSGSPYALHYRGLLGKFRFTNGVRSGNTWEVQEGLRLLRHANSPKELKAACYLVAQQGPLAALREEAERVAHRRTEPRMVKEVELLMLQYGAPLLASETAERALDTLMACRESRPPRRGMAWELESKRLDVVWRAIAQIARRIDGEPEYLTIMLDDILGTGGSSDLDYMFSRLVHLWEPQAWNTPHNAERTARILVDSDAWQQTRTELSDIERRFIADSGSNHLTGAVTGLSDVARLVDDSILGVAKVPEALEGDMILVLREQIAETRTSAGRGAFSGRSIVPANLAVAFTIETGREDLWPDIVGLLTDPRVQRDDKSAALDRLARNPDNIPVEARRDLISQGSAILSTTDVMFDSSGPYPEAIRLLTALDALTADEINQLVAELMAKRTADSTAEGGRTILAVVAAGQHADWAAPLALWLTHEPGIRARGFAAQALAVLAARGSASATAIERITTLLQQDGTFVALAILAELADPERPISGNLRSVVAATARSHPSSDVRAAARKVLATGSEDNDSERRARRRRRK